MALYPNTLLVTWQKTTKNKHANVIGWQKFTSCLQKWNSIRQFSMEIMWTNCLSTEPAGAERRPNRSNLWHELLKVFTLFFTWSWWGLLWKMLYYLTLCFLFLSRSMVCFHSQTKWLSFRGHLNWTEPHVFSRTMTFCLLSPGQSLTQHVYPAKQQGFISSVGCERWFIFLERFSNVRKHVWLSSD